VNVKLHIVKRGVNEIVNEILHGEKHIVTDVILLRTIGFEQAVV
jgi:hypothetical protein